MAQSGSWAWRNGNGHGAVHPSPGAPRLTSRQELRSRLARLQREYADLHTALFEASQVHRRLCAPRLVRHGQLEIASEIFAVRYLPGDFFTIEDAGSSGAILALGDVCGKGLAAGMWTPCVVGLVRAHAAATADPQAIVTGVNREFCRMHAPLTSLFVARLAADGALDYSSCGHPPTMLLRHDGRIEWLTEGGMLLGMAGDASFRTGRVSLGPGDVLVAYSDGVIESRDEADQEFGSERLEAHLRVSRDASADTLLFSLLAAVQDFAAPRPLMDDTSLVIVRRSLTA